MRRIIIIEDDGKTDIGVDQYEGLYDYGVSQGCYDPCSNCSNNPKNNPNASGICCCALPDMYNKRYFSTFTTTCSTYTITSDL